MPSDPADFQQATGVLVCAECGTESEGRARGWRALPTGDEGQVDGIETFCSDCAREEFDDA